VWGSSGKDALQLGKFLPPARPNQGRPTRIVNGLGLEDGEAEYYLIARTVKAGSLRTHHSGKSFETRLSQHHELFLRV
jgi:hypothetical protein